MEHLFATYIRKIQIMERTMERFSQIENSTNDNVLWLAKSFTRDCLKVAPKENKPVKPVKEHWMSGIQPKFLDAALQ